MLEESFPKFRDRKAFICMDKALTYGELDDMSRALAAWLQSKGLKPGARVAIMMPNVLQYPIAIAAILRAGYVVVNFNPLYTAREVEYQLKDCGAEAIIVLENFAHTVQDAVARTNVKHVVVASMGDLLGLLKGTIVNLVVRKVKKTGAGLFAAGRDHIQRRARRRRDDDIAAGRRSALTTWRSCNIPAAPPASPRARRSSTATSSPT